MKPFDLQKALNGAPVKLRNGDKAFIFKNIQNTPIVDFDVDYPLIGMLHNHTTVHVWSLSGKIYLGNDCAPGDIMGMWEEPKLTSEQVLEKAFNEDLFVAQSTNVNIKLKVIAKSKDGVFVLEADNGFVSKSCDGEYVLYKDPVPKSDTITVTLPKPFKPKPNDKFWFIDKVGGHLQVSHKIKSSHALTGDGNYFRTKSDAQAWLDAMKNALED